MDADQVTYISLLTGAMEINNVIGHALEETPLRIKDSPLLPSCDGMKSLKDGAYKQNKPSMVQTIKHYMAHYHCAETDSLWVINGMHMYMLPHILNFSEFCDEIQKICRFKKSYLYLSKSEQ